MHTEYEVKVALEGDTLVLSHDNQDGQITVPYASEDYTATEAVRDLLDNLYSVDVEFVHSADLPGGHLYRVVEVPDGDHVRDTIAENIMRNMTLLVGPEPRL